MIQWTIVILQATKGVYFEIFCNQVHASANSFALVGGITFSTGSHLRFQIGILLFKQHLPVVLIQKKLAQRS